MTASSCKYSGAGKQGLTRAEALAAKWLSEHAASPADVASPAPIFREDVLAILRGIGGDGAWPTQARPNVTDTGKAVPGACFGLVFALGQGPQCSLATQCFPNVARVLTRWCNASLPKTRDGKHFPYSSIQVNYNYAAKKHVDGNNIGPSYITSLGSHSGGQLWTADQGVIDCRGRWRLFDGNKEHATEPFAPVAHAEGPGERISFIAFAHGSYSTLKLEVVSELKALGFPAARSDGKDEEFLVRHRIERSYLSDEHNAAFRECLGGREELSTAALKNHPGALSVECYGRQAERGGGWMAFNEDGKDKVTKVAMTPNSTGIWMAQLKFTGTTGDDTNLLEMGKFERLNFYADVNKATAHLKKCLGAMPEGSPVVFGIADTACAAKRPITAAAYALFEQFGAPFDMPKIEYRAAWAMIGYKGCVPGQAAVAMGDRSTLLRIDCSAQRIKGKTILKKLAAPSLLSIIDVVTGGGQDCAVSEKEEPALVAADTALDVAANVADFTPSDSPDANGEGAAKKRKFK
jgi:hypothetical protein